MNLTIKKIVALALALALWAVETWLLVDAAGYTFTPQVAVIPAATAALAFLPLVLKDASNGLRTAILLSCLFLVGFVFSGVLERTGGQLDTKIAAAQSQTEGRRLLEAELVRERARLIDAENNMKGESRRGGCGPTCKTWQSAAVGIQARIDGLLSELSTQAPTPVADPVSQRFADMTGGVFAVDTVRNWRPAFQPLGFLVAIWALFAFSFMNKETTVSEVSAGNSDSRNNSSGGGGKSFRGIHLVQGGPIDDYELKALRAALSSGRKLTNDELADLMGVGKAEASRRVSKAQSLGIVSRVRTGRHVAISMNHAH
ncbi:MAG: hypothetical protein IPM06_18120 [Rhizobiales bacterium]|nr:hypothetical protein [Hyphomicrobiales bacterium]